MVAGPRQVLEDIVFKFRTAVPWRDLPERFGPWRTVHGRFARWAADGTPAPCASRAAALLPDAPGGRSGGGGARRSGGHVPGDPLDASPAI
ncbi:transposase [Streptomyces griseosporeus]|uniref:transposase n=1 Tax=Streptomyces griseosporeus TaxID=1910 RepID=UPI0036FE6B82